MTLNQLREMEWYTAPLRVTPMDDRSEFDETTPRQVRDAALRLLTGREHTARELRRKLLARGYPEELIDPVLEGLLEEGLLSEERFVEGFLHSRFDRGSGPLKIRAELHARGAAESVVAELLDARERQWTQLAREVRHKRFGADVPADARERARQMRFLQRRGFTAEQVRAAFEDDDS